MVMSLRRPTLTPHAGLGVPSVLQRCLSSPITALLTLCRELQEDLPPLPQGPSLDLAPGSYQIKLCCVQSNDPEEPSGLPG